MTITVPAQDVRPGDALVEVGPGDRVTGEPMTMHSGLGMFDELEVFVGVPVSAPGGRAAVRRFAPDQLVRVHRPG